MKKVFLDDLPRRGKFIDWKNSIGHKIKFIYDDLEDEIEIIDYQIKVNRGYLNVKYHNNVSLMCTTMISNCQLGELLGKYIMKYRYNIGDIVETRLGKIKILDKIRIYNNSKRGYIFECLIDGYKGQTDEYRINRGQSCPVCTGRIALKGETDLWTSHPYIASLLKYPQIGYELKYGSNKYEVFICPDCKTEKSALVSSIAIRGFTCSVCGDGISYPNKFIRNFLNQINETYIPEYSPDWSNGKIYDNCLIDRNEIWEIHGLQHYEGINWLNCGGRNLKEEQDNDRLKKELAEQNGFRYVEIDAKYSDVEYIKNSLLNLSEIHRYDLNNIDWDLININSLKSLVKVACDYWNSGIKSTLEISKIMGLSVGTIIDYLKRSASIGWCDYDPKERMKESAIKNGEVNKKTVIQLSLDDDFIKIWESASKAGRELNISQGDISSVCLGIRKTAKGFKWVYLKDYNNIIELTT